MSSGNARSAPVDPAGCELRRWFWDNVLMRNTSKSQSLIRAREDRERLAESESGDSAPNVGADSAPTEPGERSRSAVMRSARAELSQHARAVENMNEAVHPRD